MKYFYLISGIFFILLPILGIRGEIEEYRVQKFGILVRMRIKKVSGLGRYSMDVEYQGKVYSKSVGTKFYLSNHNGEVIQMKYLEGSNKVMFPEENNIIEFISLTILLIFGFFCILVGFGFFSKWHY